MRNIPLMERQNTNIGWNRGPPMLRCYSYSLPIYTHLQQAANRALYDNKFVHVDNENKSVKHKLSRLANHLGQSILLCRVFCQTQRDLQCVVWTMWATICYICLNNWMGKPENVSEHLFHGGSVRCLSRSCKRTFTEFCYMSVPTLMISVMYCTFTNRNFEIKKWNAYLQHVWNEKNFGHTESSDFQPSEVHNSFNFENENKLSMKRNFCFRFYQFANFLFSSTRIKFQWFTKRTV